MTRNAKHLTMVVIGVDFNARFLAVARRAQKRRPMCLVLHRLLGALGAEHIAQ